MGELSSFQQNQYNIMAERPRTASPPRPRRWNRLNQQTILLRRDAFKADAVIEMMPDGETVRHSDTLANRAYRQRGLLLLHRQPKPEQGAEQRTAAASWAQEGRFMTIISPGFCIFFFHSTYQRADQSEDQQGNRQEHQAGHQLDLHT